MNNSPAPSDPGSRPPCRQAADSLSCETCVEFFLDYIDGVLPDEERFRFESHIAFCEDCAAYLDNYRKAAAMTEGVGREERAAQMAPMPDDLVRAILKAARERG